MASADVATAKEKATLINDLIIVSSHVILSRCSLIPRDIAKGAPTEADAQHLQNHSADDEQRPEGYSPSGLRLLSSARTWKT